MENQHEIIDPAPKSVKISLTKIDWYIVKIWVQGTQSEVQDDFQKKCLRELLDETLKPNLIEIRDHSDYTLEFAFDIPRTLLRSLLSSIGRVAYSLEVKNTTSFCAKQILTHVEDQIKIQFTV